MKKLHEYEYEGWPTTRRYPRTLDEAFPQDRLGEWFEYHKRLTPTIHDVVLYALTVLALGLLLKLVV